MISLSFVHARPLQHNNAGISSYRVEFVKKWTGIHGQIWLPRPLVLKSVQDSTGVKAEVSCLTLRACRYLPFPVDSPATNLKWLKGLNCSESCVYFAQISWLVINVYVYMIHIYIYIHIYMIIYVYYIYIYTRKHILYIHRIFLDCCCPPQPLTEIWCGILLLHRADPKFINTTVRPSHGSWDALQLVLVTSSRLVLVRTCCLTKDAKAAAEAS